MGKPGGRLKFFKDGVLCLELTHHGEGERTKWVQIRSKTVFPTMVHTVKEATIPCHSTPSSFASPSSLTHNHRVESSTSHSLSDDACSMLSSPRARESQWKQAVPQRDVSTCLQFYMKPALCALKLRGKLKELSSQDQNRKRWPYNYRRTDIFLKSKNSVQCCCDEQSRVLNTDSSISLSVNNNNNDDSKQNSSDETDNDNDKDKDNDNATKRKLVETTNSTKAVSKRKVSLEKVVENLEKVAEKLFREVKSSKTNGDVSEQGRKCGSVKAPSLTPKKRPFNEVETKESNHIRPKKKSPNRAHDGGRTILNIPGLNNDFYKRHIPTKSTKSPGQATSLLAAGLEVVDFSKNRKSGGGLEVNSRKQSNRSPHFGAKSVSPGTGASGGSTIKPGLTSELVDRISGRNSSRLSDERLSPRHHTVTVSSDPQEQQYFQQQTVSKAISYTINSLLGSGSVANESGSSSSTLPISKRGEYASSHKLPPEVLSSHSTSKFHEQRESKHNSPVRNSVGSQDQKSFLRHLLDTSDPIPSLKSGDRSSKNLSRPAPVSHTSSSSNNSSRNSASVLKSSKPSSNHNHVPVTSINTSVSKSGSGKSSVSSHGPMHSAKDPMSEVQQSIATNIALQSLMSSLPFGVGSPYELLARGAAGGNQHSTDALTAAAAAAAALQYGSLIPGNPFVPGNSSMAAAMAASYFGMMQPMPNFPPMSATPPSSSSGSQSSPPPTSKSGSGSGGSSSIRKRQHELLNSNQRGSWSGMVNGGPHPHGTASFRKSSTATSTNSQQSPSSGRSSSSAISSVEIPSCGALNLSAKKKNKVEEQVDLDAPLDLCKKSSR